MGGNLRELHQSICWSILSSPRNVWREHRSYRLHRWWWARGSEAGKRSGCYCVSYPRSCGSSHSRCRDCKH